MINYCYQKIFIYRKSARNLLGGHFSGLNADVRHSRETRISMAWANTKTHTLLKNWAKVNWLTTATGRNCANFSMVHNVYKLFILDNLNMQDFGKINQHYHDDAPTPNEDEKKSRWAISLLILKKASVSPLRGRREVTVLEDRRMWYVNWEVIRLLRHISN